MLTFDKYLSTVIFVIMPGIVMHGIVEYLESGFSIYFLRDVTNITVIHLFFLLYALGLLSKSAMLTLDSYCIIAAIFSTFIIGKSDPNFNFNENFILAELLINVLIFAMGMLIHLRQILYLVIINSVLIIFCFFTTGSDFPIQKFIYFGMIVGGSSTMAYFIQKSFIKLGKKVKEANSLIRIQNENLKEMNKSKDRLFRIIGHDLRTPFHQLQSLTELLEETTDESERAEIISLLKQSAEKGNFLLKDLLTWGNLYKNKAEIILEKQSLNKIIERAFEFSDLKGRDKNISLINKIPSNLELTINPTMMETVLRNLIANSIKFSHRGSAIVVRSEKIGRQVRIAIVDWGVGMCADKLRNLFKEEINSSSPGTEGENGTGFGLNIAKNLVEKQNGVFEIESEYQKGTTIYLSFPIGLSA